jgi:phosphohistidine phosphatase
MMLYLCRHAAAENAGEGMRDEDRALTADGRDKFRKAAKGFASLEPGVTHIVTSPLLRARQTAQILYEILNVDGEPVKTPQVLDTLGPPGKMDGFLAYVRGMEEAGNVIAVGHEPIMSEWIGQLCFEEHGRCALKKGAIAAIELAERNRGELLWLMQPKQLRQLS